MHGPQTSHQSQSKNENVNQVINGVCWSTWLSVGLADSSRCVEFDEVSCEERQENRIVGKAYTSQLH